MKLGWGPRQILALVLLALFLTLMSGLIELASTVRMAVEAAAVESGLVSQILLLQIRESVSDQRGDPLEAVRGDPSVGIVLRSATAQAPSVVYVALCDPAGRAVVHTTPEMVGRELAAGPALPRIGSLFQSFRVLAGLAQSPPVYEEQTPLLLGGTPFASIRVGVAAGLVRDRVGAVFRRRLGVAGVQLVLAVCVGVVLAWLLRGRVRRLQEGVAALREGRFDARIPEEGVDEFSRLARDLNLLSEEFERVRRGHDANLRRTVELLGDGILTLGPKLEVVLVNGPAARILGIDAGALGSRLSEILPAAHPVRQLAETLYGDGSQTLAVALPGGGPDGEHVAVGHRIAGQDGPGGVLIEIKETTALRELHSLVDQSRVLRRLGQMAAGVAHEISNPLQTIHFELGRLREPEELDREAVREHVDTALEEIRRLQRAVTGFLKIARLQRLSLGQIPVAEFLAEIQSALEAEANLAGCDLELQVAEEIPPITGDREVLRQAVQNLVRNAIQAQPSASGKIVLRGSAEAGTLQLAVADQGPGIPPESLERVFDLYYTTKEEGTGVGLALVRQAAEMHGGNVELESRLGEGTTVRIRIPYTPESGGAK